MSSYMKKGKRKSVHHINKKRMDRITYILEELDLVAQKLIQWSIDNKQTIDKEKIKELADDMTDVPIEDLEVSILWAKLNDFQNKLHEYRERGTKEEGNNIT